MKTGGSKQTNFVSNFQEFFDEEELSPASYFKEMDKTKIDLHKILDNFYKKCVHIETIVSYVNTYILGQNSSINSLLAFIVIS